MPELNLTDAIAQFRYFMRYGDTPQPEYSMLVSRLQALRHCRDCVSVVNMGCCAFKEISGLSGRVPETVLDGLCVQYAPGLQCAYILFTQATMPDSDPNLGYGFAFARFLADHKLGEVTQTAGPTRNPNSGNNVVMFTWQPDPGAVKRWFCNRHDPLLAGLYGANLL